MTSKVTRRARFAGSEGKISPFNGVVYVQVNDVEASCQKVKELEATIVPGFPFNLPDGVGAIALVIRNQKSAIKNLKSEIRNQNPDGCAFDDDPNSGERVRPRALVNASRVHELPWPVASCSLQRRLARNPTLESEQAVTH